MLGIIIWLHIYLEYSIMFILQFLKKCFSFVKTSPKPLMLVESKSSDDSQEMDKLRHFDASFACSGLVDIAGIRSAIFQWKHDENEKSNEVLPKAAAKQSQLDKS